MKRRLKTSCGSNHCDESKENVYLVLRKDTAQNENDCCEDEPETKRRRLNFTNTNCDKDKKLEARKERELEVGKVVCGFDVYLHKGEFNALNAYNLSKSESNQKYYSILSNDESKLVAFGYVRNETESENMDIAFIISKYIESDSFIYRGFARECDECALGLFCFIDVKSDQDIGSVILSLKLISSQCVRTLPHTGGYRFNIGLFGWNSNVLSKKEDFLKRMKASYYENGKIHGARYVMKQDSIAELGFESGKHEEWHWVEFGYYPDFLGSGGLYHVDDYPEAQSKHVNKRGLLDRRTLKWGKSRIELCLNLKEKVATFTEPTFEDQIINTKRNESRLRQNKFACQKHIHSCKLSSNMNYLFFVNAEDCACNNGMTFEIQVAQEK